MDHWGKNLCNNSVNKATYIFGCKNGNCSAKLVGRARFYGIENVQETFSSSLLPVHAAGAIFPLFSAYRVSKAALLHAKIHALLALSQAQFFVLCYLHRVWDFRSTRYHFYSLSALLSRRRVRNARIRMYKSIFNHEKHGFRDLTNKCE